VAFPASPAAAFITGTNIIVAGGFTNRVQLAARATSIRGISAL
jgi:hypothetical protein